MVQIRRGIFETNSSSVHTIAIDERDLDKNKVPKKVTFKLDNYGWGFSNISNMQDYIWTAIVMSVQNADEMVLLVDQIICHLLWKKQCR